MRIVLTRTVFMFGIGAALLVSPFFVSADAISELQAQLAALQAQIAAMSAGSTGGSARPADPQVSDRYVPYNQINQMAYSCTLYVTLKKGSSGSEVECLQRLLTASGVYTGPITSYFGSLTEAAVKQFQCKIGIVCSGTAASTGWGNVGQRTRAALNGGGYSWGATTSSGSGNSIPVPGATSDSNSGSAPGTSGGSSGTNPPSTGTGSGSTVIPTETGTLTLSPSTVKVGVSVTATGTVGGGCGGQSRDAYTISWGDGTSVQVPAMVPTSNVCTMEYRIDNVTATHAYSSTGTYTVTFTTGSKSASKSVVVTAGTTSTVDPGANPQCKTWNDGCNTCGRSAPGGNAFCTEMYCAVKGTPYCSATF